MKCSVTDCDQQLRTLPHITTRRRQMTLIYLMWLCLFFPTAVCHAEMNAILNKNSSDLHGCTLYVTLFPCNECAKLVIQSGIREVVYLSGKHYEDREMVAARRLLNLAGVTYRRHVPKQAEIRIDLSVEDATVAQTP